MQEERGRRSEECQRDNLATKPTTTHGGRQDEKERTNESLEEVVLGAVARPRCHLLDERLDGQVVANVLFLLEVLDGGLAGEGVLLLALLNCAVDCCDVCRRMRQRVSRERAKERTLKRGTASSGVDGVALVGRLGAQRNHRDYADSERDCQEPEAPAPAKGSGSQSVKWESRKRKRVRTSRASRIQSRSR